MSKREQNKAEKRRKILDAALELFAERGFHGTPVPMIASRAGVGAGTIYRFVQSKEELVNEVFRETKTRLKRALEHELEIEQAPYLLFSEIWRRLVTFARQEPLAFRFLELQDHAPYLDPASRALEHSVLEPIVNTLLAYRERGVFRPTLPLEASLALIWGSLVAAFKAERNGYLIADDAALDAIRDACWRACATPAFLPTL